MKFHSLEKESIEPAAPYSVLAKVYDQMMIHVNYRQWAKYIAAIAKKEDLWLRGRLLDVGCGTGRFLTEIRAMGQEGDGCDPSREMLRYAEKRVPADNLIRAGLPELEGIPLESYQIITCLYDTMNYMTDEDQLAASLLSIYRKLQTPGVFIFDVVSESHCKHHFKNYYDSDVLDNDYAYFRESYYDVKEKLQYNWIRIYSPQGIFEEEHCQRIYSFSSITHLIRRYTSFHVAHIYDDFSFDPANRHSGRVHFVLQKR